MPSAGSEVPVRHASRLATDSVGPADSVHPADLGARSATRGVAQVVARAARLLAVRDEATLGAGDRRLRRAGLAGLGMAGNKGLQVFVTLVSVPLLLDHLGTGGFGLLMAISGFTLWFQADLGLAEGVKLRLIECFARDDRAGARTYVSTGFAALLALTAGLGVLLALCWTRIDWAHWFRTDAAQADAVGAAVLAGLALTLVVIPLKLLREVTTAEQRGYVYSAWVAAGTALSLVGIWIATRSGAGLVGVLLGLQGAGVLALLSGTTYLFLRDRPWLRPRLADVRREAWSRLWPDSSHLLLLGVSLMAINGSDAFLVNAVLGNGAAAEYILAIRIPFYAQVIVSCATYPAWPAIGDAVARGDRAWAQRAARRVVRASTAVAGTLLLVYALFGTQLIAFWSGGRIRPSWGLVLLLALYVMARVVAATYHFLLRAHGRVRGQAWITAAEAVLHVGLGIVGARLWGLEGMALGALVSVVATRLWAAPLEYHRVRASWMAEEAE